MKKESQWYLVYFNPEYHIYTDLFHLGQQFNLTRFYWRIQRFSHSRHDQDRKEDSFTVYHENGDIGKCMGRCQGEWIKISTRKEYDLAKMLYPLINFEVEYELLPYN